MKWSSALAVEDDLEEALQQCIQKIRADLEGQAPDLLLVFVSPHHSALFDCVPRLLVQELQPAQILGCCGSGLIGGGREREHQVAFSLTAALLPHTRVNTFHLDASIKKPLTLNGLTEAVGMAPEDGPAFILLSDPFTFPTESSLALFDQAYPFSQKIGGLVSGGESPGDHVLYAGGHMYHGGMVGAALEGPIAMDTIVAQGCRPIGLPQYLTSSHGNIIVEINGHSPKLVLEELYRSLNSEEREIFRHSLFLGIEMQPEERVYNRGDYLIRNLLGMDLTNGYLQVGADVSKTRVIQFHLRDRNASIQDLTSQLTRYREVAARFPPRGALLFSCLGRGQAFFGVPDHDSNLFHEELGEVPLGGFFCNGEIGPVQGRTYIHGYTSCFGVFREKEERHELHVPPAEEP
ncbi:FIST C-terminal domain-containing protein [Sulfidibacter corallicola]|uniref:FIST C-terminal domain-containing protein n=1 Tax=Sulfidibacter corallicola TaxID=2818388 RepID=A0A8A4TME6_SULCO|nr:FIST N-terminal domain-containing protein [Sulfidibacter corallicola]QTD51159.1 FIST C-terminal domain-containing protein [Sulfidibacter corallicola]